MINSGEFPVSFAIPVPSLFPRHSHYPEIDFYYVPPHFYTLTKYVHLHKQHSLSCMFLQVLLKYYFVIHITVEIIFLT